MTQFLQLDDERFCQVTIYVLFGLYDSTATQSSSRPRLRPGQAQNKNCYTATSGPSPVMGKGVPSPVFWRDSRYIFQEGVVTSLRDVLGCEGAMKGKRERGNGRKEKKREREKEKV